MSELSSAPLRLLPTAPRTRAITITVIVALVVFADIRLGGLRIAEISLAVVAGAGAITLAARFPGVGLCVLLGFVPLQQIVVGWMYKHGMPTSLAKDLGYIKDAMVAGIVVAALLKSRDAHRHARAHAHRWTLDFLDKCAAVYVAIATIYLVLPFLVPSALGGQPFQIRLNAWRLDCLFVVLMVAARRVQFSSRAFQAARVTIVSVGILMLIVAAWESASPGGYNHFLQSTIGYPKYQVDVLKVMPPQDANYVIYNMIGGLKIQRVGSLFADSLELGFFMLIPLGLCVERLGIRRPSTFSLIGLGAAVATVVLTETRSAILGAGIAIVLAVRLAFRNLAPGRYRLAVLVALAAVIAVPFSANSVFQHRLSSTFNSSGNASNSGHSYNSITAAKDIIRQPQGKGLGTNPATGQHFHTSNLTVSENSYLQVGTELGAVAMFAFVGMYLAALTRLRREARGRGERASMAAGIWLAGWALFVGGWFLHVWTLFPVSLAFWGLGGAAMGPPRRVEPLHAPAL